MQTSTTPMLVAAGAAVVVGLIGAVVVLRVARRWPAWAVAAAPVFAVACIAAGVTAAAQQMLLEAEELTAVVSVLVLRAMGEWQTIVETGDPAAARKAQLDAKRTS